MSWDFSTEPEFQAKLDWVEQFCRDEVEPLEYVFPYAIRSKEPEDPRPGQGPAGSGSGPGPVGDLPRRRARRSRLRPAEARAPERDPRPLPVGAADVRRGRARHRQHGDARRVRNRRAEEALARADAQPGDVVGVLDDRAAGRFRSEPVPHPRRARWRRVGHQRREVVHERRTRRRHPLRDVHERHVRRAPQDPGRRDHARAPQPQPHHLPRRAHSRSTIYSGPKTVPRCSRSGASAAVASITRCARSRSASSPST